MQKRNVILFTCLCSIMSITLLRGQIYNYEPIRHNNFETNPSYLASEKNNFTASLIHHGKVSFSPKFYYDALRVSFYSRNYFTGIGLTINNTHVNDSTHYNYLGIGGAYRVILLNMIYTKIGFLYKRINTTSPPGSFTYYSFVKSNHGEIKKSSIDNANVSISFSSSHENTFLSVGILNLPMLVGSAKEPGLFPQYYFLNAGNFAKIIHLDDWDVSYSAVTKKYAQQTITPFSHYLTVVYNGFHLTRYSSLRYGARAGFADNDHLQLNPVLALCKRIKKQEYIVCQLMYDMAIPLKTKIQPFKPHLQFNLTYLF